MADRQLRVTLIGDSRQLDRTLGRVESRLGTFGKTAAKTSGIFGKFDSKSLFAGAAGGAGFFAATAAAQALGSALKTGVNEAAQLETSSRSIDSLFGSAAGGVKKFSEQAASLGISAVESQKLSVRIGLLSHNLGIGQEKAAEMTIGLQKLAGSIAEIRGIDPAEVLQNLPLALAGNLRSLKQLGFAFSAAQIKAEALSEGLIGVNQALTPAAKAQAIAALATKGLAELEDQAAQHSGDLVHQQHKLSAETANLEAAIGKLATGPLTEATTQLTELAGAALSAGAAFNALGKASGIPGGGNLLGKAFKFAPTPTGTLNLGEAIGKGINDLLGRGGGGKAGNTKASQAFLDAIALIRRQAVASGDIGGRAAQPIPAPVKGLSVALQNREVDARLSGSSSALKAVLGQEAAVLEGALRNKHLSGKDKLALKEALLSITSEIDSINQSLKDAADASKQDAARAKTEAAATRKAQKEAAAAAKAAAAEKLKAAAQGLLSAAQDKLSALLSKRQADRGLEDARAALKVAKQIGGPQGIKLARRDVQDALLAKEQAQLESARIRGQGKGTFSVTINGGITLNGIQNVKQLLAELQRLDRGGSPQHRGRTPGAYAGLH